MSIFREVIVAIVNPDIVAATVKQVRNFSLFCSCFALFVVPLC